MSEEQQEAATTQTREGHLSFDDAVRIAEEAFTSYEVESISLTYRDTDGTGHWAVTMRPENDPTAPRIDIRSHADWYSRRVSPCTHPWVLLERDARNEYTARATCHTCGYTIGGRAQDSVYVVDTASRLASMLLEIRSMLLHAQQRGGEV